MNARGKVGIIHLLLLVGLAGALYWGINYGPIYLDHMEAKQAAQTCFSRVKVHDLNDDAVFRLCLEMFNGAPGRPGPGSHVETDRMGNTSVQNGLGLKPEQLTIERDEVRNMVTVTVDYSRTFDLKPFKDKTKTLNFHIVKTGTIH